MKKFIISIILTLTTIPATRFSLSDMQPEDLIEVRGKSENIYIPWKHATPYIVSQVQLNFTHNPENPEIIRLRGLDDTVKTKIFIESDQIERSLKKFMQNANRNTMLNVALALDVLEAEELQDKMHKSLAKIKHNTKLLHQSYSGKKIALIKPVPCKPGQKDCKKTMLKGCRKDFGLVNAGPVLYGKCRKIIEPINGKCPKGSQRVFDQFNPMQLVCALVREPKACPQGFKAKGIECHQTAKCPQGTTMIEDGPNIGWCKRKPLHERKSCKAGYELVTSGPVLYGKCRKLVDPVGDKCPKGAQKILELLDPAKLVCAFVEEPTEL